MQIRDVIQPQHVLILKARSKADLLTGLAARAADAIGLEAKAIFDLLMRREDLGSTGVGAGVAIPHTSIASLREPLALIARLDQPVPFDAIDGEPVDIVCLILTPIQAGREPLGVLACVVRRLRSPGVLAAIRKARDAGGIFEAWREPV